MIVLKFNNFLITDFFFKFNRTMSKSLKEHKIEHDDTSRENKSVKGAAQMKGKHDLGCACSPLPRKNSLILYFYFQFGPLEMNTG